MANELIPENDTQELWQMSGTVDALHRFMLAKAAEGAASKYQSEPLDDDMRMVCVIMGFNDALAIKKEAVEAGERSLNFADD